MNCWINHLCFNLGDLVAGVVHFLGPPWFTNHSREQLAILDRSNPIRSFVDGCREFDGEGKGYQLVVAFPEVLGRRACAVALARSSDTPEDPTRGAPQPLTVTYRDDVVTTTAGDQFSRLEFFLNGELSLVRQRAESVPFAVCFVVGTVPPDIRRTEVFRVDAYGHDDQLLSSWQEIVPAEPADGTETQGKSGRRP